MCARPLEPERGDLRQHFALVGNAGAEHVVERRDAIGGDDEQTIAEIVDVADLALTIGRAAGERGLRMGAATATDPRANEKAWHLTGAPRR